jgi:hypothetical protein
MPATSPKTKLTLAAQSLEKKVTRETKTAVKPFLRASRDFLTARAIARRPSPREPTTTTTKLTKALIRETARFTIKAKVLEKNAAIEARIAKIPVLTAIRPLLKAEARFTKNPLMAKTIARKLRLMEALTEAMNLAKPDIKEKKNLLIDSKTLKKSPTMEAKMATKPVLMASGIFLTVDTASITIFLARWKIEANPLARAAKNPVIEA